RRATGARSWAGRSRSRCSNVGANSTGRRCSPRLRAGRSPPRSRPPCSTTPKVRAVMAELAAHSVLAHRAADLAGVSAATGGRISLVEVPFLAQVDVRVSPNEAARRELLLPFEPNSVLRSGDRAALWL